MRVGGLAALVAASLLCHASLAVADVGYRGPGFTASSVVKPSGQKPQSKLWYHDGTWWASMFAPGVEAYHVFRLDWLTQTWVDTGTPLDERNSSSADVLWDGSHLYVASSSDLAGSPDATRIRILRLTYDNVGRQWVRDPTYDAVMPGGPVETWTRTPRDACG